MRDHRFPTSIPAKSVVVLQLEVKECEGVQVLEHVQAKLTINSHKRGDLKIQLTSPMGTRVVLLDHRAHDNSRAGFNLWPFMSVHSWGEYPSELGSWRYTTTGVFWVKSGPGS
ncbi:hypothetical protein NQ318_003549 [Aromia moschata]|uniref:P/Homo B domain-containing protein n=1 Tax=Aromia moschata TaxID=1265417 RepID=A0AAV8YV84_9CUCU|nr:hypothetical protein NQ318_003549 [Aromia moschata]